MGVVGEEGVFTDTEGVYVRRAWGGGGGARRERDETVH